MELGRHNHEWCWQRMKANLCPCMSCRHDKAVEDPESDTKCCDLINHRESCRDGTPCPDYEPEDGGRE